MAIFYALGDALVGIGELRAKAKTGQLAKFRRLLADATGTARLEFKSGVATAGNLLDSFANPKGRTIGFEEIGIGKPLTVELRHVYTGDKAEGFWGSKDMLVTSAMKGIATFDAAPRAINFLEQKTKKNQNFRTVDAVKKGTPLVCYSPSLAASSSVVTVEIAFDNFPKNAFDTVATAFGAAGGLPIFAPAGPYLVAAGLVTRILGKVGKALSNGTPALKRTEEITFVTPGSEIALAHFVLLIGDNVEESVLDKYKIDKKGALVSVADERRLYDGPHPYAVISLDGRKNDDFEKFAPVAASAALLDRFYNIGDGSSQPLDQLLEGLKVYNDLKFREKAKSAAERLRAIGPDCKEYKDLSLQYKAYVGNIQNADLKLPGTP